MIDDEMSSSSGGSWWEGDIEAGGATAPEWSELVRVARFWEVHRAHAAQAFLLSEGIEAFLRNAHVSGVAWHYGAAGGGIPLEVREEDAARARELLASHGELAAEAGSLKSAPLEVACPRCGASAPEPFSRTAARSADEAEPVEEPGGVARLVAAVAAWLVGGAVEPGPRTDSLRCRVCGLVYQE